MKRSCHRRPYRVATFALVPALCLALAACGSSSATTSSSSATSSGSPAGPPTGGAGAKGFASLRSCLAKQGISLPQRPRSTRPPTGATGGGGFLGGGGAGRRTLRPPAGVSTQKFQAALQKCGAGAGFGRRRLDTPAFKASLTSFAACMRANGVNLPAPNTTGNGPVFNTRGLNTASASFRAADAKCAPQLRGSFRGGTSPPAA